MCTCHEGRLRTKRKPIRRICSKSGRGRGVYKHSRPQSHLSTVIAVPCIMSANSLHSIATDRHSSYWLSGLPAPVAHKRLGCLSRAYYIDVHISKRILHLLTPLLISFHVLNSFMRSTCLFDWQKCQSSQKKTQQEIANTLVHRGQTACHPTSIIVRPTVLGFDRCCLSLPLRAISGHSTVEPVLIQHICTVSVDNINFSKKKYFLSTYVKLFSQIM